MFHLSVKLQKVAAKMFGLSVKLQKVAAKMFYLSVKLQRGAAKMFDLSVRKKARKIKIPRIFFLLSEGFFVEVLKLFYQLFKIIAVAAFSVFFGRF